MKIVKTNVANTASCQDDVTALQDNVRKDVNQAGTPKLVSRVCFDASLVPYFGLSINI